MAGQFGPMHNNATLGHEGIGRVITLGSLANPKLLGERVGLPWLYSSCGDCALCCSGKENLCQAQKDRGLHVPGAFSPYTLASSQYIIPIPPSLTSANAAPLLCAGVTTWRALKEATLTPGDTLGIMGAGGGLGSLATKIALAQGHKVVGIDVEAKRTFILELGATFLPSTSTPQDIQSSTGGGFHACLLIAPSLPSIELGIASLRASGTAVLVGLASGKISVDVCDMVLKGKKLVGSLVGTRQDCSEVLAFCASHKISCPSTLHTPEQLTTCLQDLASGTICGRQVIVYQGDSTLPK